MHGHRRNVCGGIKVENQVNGVEGLFAGKKCCHGLWQFKVERSTIVAEDQFHGRWRGREAHGQWFAREVHSSGSERVHTEVPANRLSTYPIESETRALQIEQICARIFSIEARARAFRRCFACIGGCNGDLIFQSLDS